MTFYDPYPVVSGRSSSVISGILLFVMGVLLIPIAALYQVYDRLQDRKFMREMNERYGGAK